MSAVRHLAIDVGAASGRAVVGAFDGERLRTSEAYRFANVPVRGERELHWDAEALAAQVVESAVRARRDGPLAALGIDTWGVDYGLIDRDGTPLGAPFSYRDERTDGVPERVAAIVSPERQYARTGIAQLSINTLYQLCVERRLLPGATLLMMADLLHFGLCGARVTERTNASTTGALALDGTWATDVLEALDLDAGTFAHVVAPGTRLGVCDAPAAREAGLAGTAVIAPATHDTASAVAAIPFERGAERAAFISSGTWSLLGFERDAPIATEAARAAGFSNEHGIGGTTRFLRNIMGLWLVQECRRHSIGAGRDLAEDAFWEGVAARPPSGLVIDVDDPALLHPADMPAELSAQLRASGQRPPDDPLDLARAVCESLALKYRAVLGVAERLAGTRADVVHVVGGGARNELLCRLTADACGVPVVAGPCEATAYGNLLVQLIATGAVAGIEQGRELVRRSVDLATYDPRPDPTLDERLDRLSNANANARARLAPR